jgi:hypothetical protein
MDDLGVSHDLDLIRPGRFGLILFRNCIFGHVQIFTSLLGEEKKRRRLVTVMKRPRQEAEPEE